MMIHVTLLDNEDGTKHEMAGLLAERFPDELASRIQRKPKAWTSENARMGIFDAVGLTVVFQLNNFNSVRSVRQ